MRLPQCVAIFYKLPWFCLTKVIYEKLQRNAENACGNRMCKRGLIKIVFSSRHDQAGCRFRFVRADCGSCQPRRFNSGNPSTQITSTLEVYLSLKQQFPTWDT